MQAIVQELISKKRFAIIGATDNPEKFGYKILQNLKSRGFEVFPVNPRLKEINGTQCYASLSDIPEKVEVVNFVVPPKVTEETLKECKKLGLNNIWLQPGSESETAIQYCRDNGMKVAYGV
jgi:uncharacterized protein